MGEVSTLDITSALGVPFRFLFIPDDAQSPNFPAEIDDRGALVEVYDRRYPFTPDGQFTGGRYFADDLLARPEGRPLAMQFGDSIRDWLVDVDAMIIVRSWLRTLMQRPARYPARPDTPQELIFI